MLLNTAGRARLFGSLIAVAACGDFTLVDPVPGDGAPRLFISVGAVTDEITQYDLNAVFSPGTDERGRPTEVIDPTLGVEGTPVLPDRETNERFWLYRWQGTQTTTPGLVLVTFPVVADASPSTHSITIPVTRRADGADVDLSRGSDLMLGLSLPNRVTTGLSGGVEFWRLEVRQSCFDNDSLALLTISGTGPHPAELRVPWQWLEALSTDQVSACFNAFSSFRVAGSLYPVDVSGFVRLAWRIHLVAPG